MASINDVLTWVPLTEAVKTIEGGIPKPMPEKFYNTKEQVQGTKFNYVTYVGTRQVSRVQPANAPPQATNKLSMGNINAIVFSSQEEMEFSEELCNVLRRWEEYAPQQSWAMRNITWQGEEFRRRFENLETALVNMNLAQGQWWFDSQGNLLPSSTGATTTVTQGVPSANTGTLNGLLTGSFADPTFDIVTFMSQKWIPRSLEDTNYMVREMIHGANIPGYFAINNYTKLQWGYQSEYAMAYLHKGEVPPSFLGFQWHNASTMYYQDNTATNQLIFPPDQITGLPEVNKTTYTVYEGSKLVPTTFGMMANADAVLGSYAEVFGRYGFSYTPQGSTFKIIYVAGTNCLPRFKIPGAVYLLNTVA